jgi:hypothetical protein
MENPNLSQSLYGDFNAIPNLVTVVENLVTLFLYVVCFMFHHMDPIAFQVRMKDLHDGPCANSILQHFTTTFI